MAAAIDHPSAPMIHTLPAEILLEIFSGIEYSPALKDNLCQVSKRFASVTNEHSACIAANILDRQFSWARRQFPGIFDDYSNSSTENDQQDVIISGAKTEADEAEQETDAEPTRQTPGWEQLTTVFQRVATLTSIKSRSKIICEGGHSDHSAWTTCRALIFHHTGLLLLYRLADCQTHIARAALIRSLPKSSLAVVLFSLMVSVHLLRALGPQSAMYHHWPDAPITEDARADVELACEELLLRDGPEFLLGLLVGGEGAVQALKTEVLSMDARQLHTPAPGSSPDDGLTLIATLRRAFAASVGCEMRYNLVHMWYVLDEDCADLTDARECVARDAMERVVNGQSLRRTCERCRLLRIYGY